MVLEHYCNGHFVKVMKKIKREEILSSKDMTHVMVDTIIIWMVDTIIKGCATHHD